MSKIFKSGQQPHKVTKEPSKCITTGQNQKSQWNSRKLTHSLCNIENYLLEILQQLFSEGPSNNHRQAQNIFTFSQFFIWSQHKISSLVLEFIFSADLP